MILNIGLGTIGRVRATVYRSQVTSCRSSPMSQHGRGDTDNPAPPALNTVSLTVDRVRLDRSSIYS